MGETAFGKLPPPVLESQVGGSGECFFRGDPAWEIEEGGFRCFGEPGPATWPALDRMFYGSFGAGGTPKLLI